VDAGEVAQQRLLAGVDADRGAPLAVGLAEALQPAAGSSGTGTLSVQ
jgi:hypothetical protein